MAGFPEMAAGPSVSYQTVSSSTPSAVGDASSRIETTLAETSELVVSLSARLEGVLRPSEPVPTSGEHLRAQDGPPRAPMTSRLHEHAEFVEQVNNRLRDLLSRLDT